MRYAYKCVNEKCELKEVEVIVNRPMSDSAKKVYCTKCNEVLTRIYGGASISTSDGFKK